MGILFPPLLCLGAKAREESLLFRASLSLQERREIRHERRRMGLSWLASLALHAAFFAVLLSDFMEPVLLSETKIAYQDEADFSLMDGMVSSQTDPVYDERSEFVIPPPPEAPKDSRLLSLENLLEKLKAEGGAALSENLGASYQQSDPGGRLKREERILKTGLKQRAGKRPGSAGAPFERRPQIQLWDHVPMTAQKWSGRGAGSGAAERGRHAAPPDSEIMKAIDQRNFQFQECYEMALLRDEKLSGKIVFLLKLNRAKVQKTHLQFEGEGSAASRRSLLSCLYQESQKLLFSKNRQKISVKFSLIFGI